MAAFKKILFAACIALALPPAGRAEGSPLGLGIFPGAIAWPGTEDGVAGLRVNPLVGVNRDVYGFDLGLINIAGRSFGGIQAGLINYTGGRAQIAAAQIGAINWSRRGTGGLGVQAAALFNRNGTGGRFFGIQLAPLNFSSGIAYGIAVALANSGGKFGGLQMGLLNAPKQMGGIQLGLANLAGRAKGIQLGIVNKTGRISGFQLGALNSSALARGFQVGLVNWTARVRGVQIGLINKTNNLTGLQIGLFNYSPGFLPMLPLLKVGF